MAIEDEIINISDIDIGTEILKSDKLLIETNNGTKMIAFKDFVVGPDNISAVRQDQIESNAIGEANTDFTVVTGFDILTDATTPGLNTAYDQISGTVELGKFNYNAIANLASVSADIASNTSALNELRKVLDNLATTLGNTSSTVLNSIVLSTSATDFTVAGATGGFFHSGAKRNVSFAVAELNPSTTNTNASLTLDPFKVTFPDENEGFVESRFSIVGNFIMNVRTSGTGRENGTITIFRDKAAGGTEAVASFTAKGNTKTVTNPLDVNTVVTIKYGDSLRLVADSPVQSGTLHGYRL